MFINNRRINRLEERVGKLQREVEGLRNENLFYIKVFGQVGSYGTGGGIPGSTISTREAIRKLLAYFHISIVKYPSEVMIQGDYLEEGDKKGGCCHEVT